MKIKCIAIGKTKSQDFSSLIKSYLSKINHYINFEFIILNEIKSIKNKSIQKNKEAEAILKNIHFIDQLSLYCRQKISRTRVHSKD